MWIYPRVIAHRGGGTLAPENTMAAMRCGLAHGFHAVEFDVMLSKDEVPVLMHDPHFGRTVAVDGRVADTAAHALCMMDAGSWHSPAFAGEPVPTLEEIVGFCRQNGIWMNIEIKPAPGFERRTGQVVGELVRRLFAADIDAAAKGASKASLPLFSSFSFDALMAARDAAPEIPRGFLLDVLPGDWRERLTALDAVALHTNHKNLTADQAKEIKTGGWGLFCYTVNDVQRARAILQWGVDAFCTDRIDLIGPGFAA